MAAYIFRRVLIAFSVILVALVVSFLLFFAAPTDPAGVLCGLRCTPDRIHDITVSLHLNDPIPTQIFDYIKGIFVGRDIITGGVTQHCSAPCLGYSYQLGEPVTSIVMDRLPVTVSIVLGASVIYVTLGVVSGVIAARRRGTYIDRVTVGTSLGLGAIPYFVVALLAALFVSGNILPEAQWTPINDDPVKWFTGLIVPWLTLGIVNASSYIRYARGSMIESLSEDYVRTARAKGLSERKVVFKHALRAAITPIVTLYGLDLAFNLTGAIFTESIFGLNGLGVMTLNAFGRYDLPVLMAGVLIGAILLVFFNLLVDILYTVLDPRVRLT
jgi:peptide/nickel transport system permease protein